MAENMMNSDHKASTKRSRNNHNRIFGPDHRDPTEVDKVYATCPWREEGDECPTCCDMPCPIAMWEDDPREDR